MKTHRCEGSLKNKVSIRYCKEYDFMPEGNETWRLLKHEYDYEYLAHCLEPICELKYCPFCGEELK